MVCQLPPCLQAGRKFCARRDVTGTPYGVVCSVAISRQFDRRGKERTFALWPLRVRGAANTPNRPEWWEQV